MRGQSVLNSLGEAAMIDEVSIEAFAAGFRGDLLRVGDPEYDAARAVWNGMIDRRPALIARCASAGDVVAAVNVARTHKLLVSVRGGGHNVAGSAVCDGGLVIDLSPMKGIQVDPESQTARARLCQNSVLEQLSQDYPPTIVQVQPEYSVSRGGFCANWRSS